MPVRPLRAGERARLNDRAALAAALARAGGSEERSSQLYAALAGTLHVRTLKKQMFVDDIYGVVLGVKAASRWWLFVGLATIIQ